MQKLLCALAVSHEVKAQGPASLAALSALCMYLKRCNANEELATGTHKVSLETWSPLIPVKPLARPTLDERICCVSSWVNIHTPELTTCQLRHVLQHAMVGMTMADHSTGGALCRLRRGSVSGRPHADQPGAAGEQHRQQRGLPPGLSGQLHLRR